MSRASYQKLTVLLLAVVAGIGSAVMVFVIFVNVMAAYYTFRLGDWWSSGAGAALSFYGLSLAVPIGIAAFFFVILSYKPARAEP